MEVNNNIKNVFTEVLSTFEKLREVFIILEQNWSQESSYELSYINLPIGIINKYIDTLNFVLEEENFSKQTVDGINQRIGNFTRNFDNPFFQTDQNDIINKLIEELMKSRRLLDEM